MNPAPEFEYSDHNISFYFLSFILYALIPFPWLPCVPSGETNIDFECPQGKCFSGNLGEYNKMNILWLLIKAGSSRFLYLLSGNIFT